MFDMANFLKTNLIEGYQNGSFTKQQVNIFAVNYLNKGQITQSDFDEIMEAMKPPKNDMPQDGSTSGSGSGSDKNGTTSDSTSKQK